MTAGPMNPELVADYQALRGRGGAAWVARDAVAVRGPDAISYLQGQLSQDVAGLAVGRSAPSLLLSPQGKVDAWLRVTRTADDAVVLDVDGGWGEAVVARLARFKLRSKVELSALDWRGLALRGASAGVLAPWAAGAGAAGAGGVGGGSGGAGAGGAGAGGLAVPAWWPGVEGVDLLGEEVSVPEGVRVCAAGSLEVLRVEAGVPAMGAELTEKTIPAEAGVVEGSVSFTKGCYTGQELVARLDARGNRVPRRLLGVVLDLTDLGDRPAPPVGAVLSGGERAAGALTSVALSPGLQAVVAMAYVRREIAAPARIELSWEGETVPVEVRELPLVAGGTAGGTHGGMAGGTPGGAGL